MHVIVSVVAVEEKVDDVKIVISPSQTLSEIKETLGFGNIVIESSKRIESQVLIAKSLTWYIPALE